MRKRLSEETREEIRRLYNKGSGLTPTEIVKQTRVSYSFVYGLTRAKERGFASRTEYEKHLVKERRGFASLAEYREHLAKERGFASRTKYEQYLAKKRQQRPENQGLGKLIVTRLKELGRNQSWLAREIKVTRQAVSLYAQGRSVPTEDLLESLYFFLDIPYKTVDHLLE